MCEVKGDHERKQAKLCDYIALNGSKMRAFNNPVHDFI